MKSKLTLWNIAVFIMIYPFTSYNSGALKIFKQNNFPVNL